MNTITIPAAEVDLRVVLRDSAHNKRARAILKDYQLSVGMTQAEFAVELSKELRLGAKGEVAMTTLSGYQTGRSNVPGAVLLAASDVVARIAGVVSPLTAEGLLRPPLTGEERLLRLEDAVLNGPKSGRRRTKRR